MILEAKFHRDTSHWHAVAMAPAVALCTPGRSVAPSNRAAVGVLSALLARAAIHVQAYRSLLS